MYLRPRIWGGVGKPNASTILTFLCSKSITKRHACPGLYFGQPGTVPDKSLLQSDHVWALAGLSVGIPGDFPN